MSDEIPGDLRYTEKHEWARRDGELIVVGITAHAVEQLGDITAVSLPDVGEAVEAGERFGDYLLLERLGELTTLEGARSRLESLDDAGRQLLLGELTVGKQACGGCHLLPASGEGVRSTTLEGGSLEAAGPRLEARVHGFRAWPRSGALAAETEGGDSRWLEQAHAEVLPWGAFAATEAERSALAIQIAGWRADPRRDPPRPAEAIIRGRAILAREGCVACHHLGGGFEGGWDRATGGARGWVPPELEGIGSKLRAEWMFTYLGDPSGESIRPFSEMRMPTFRLDADERDAIVRALSADAGSPIFSALDYPDSRGRRGSGEGLETANETIGEILYAVMACGRCHAGPGEDLGAPSPGSSSASAWRPAPAPDYTAAVRRLRPEWLIGWVLRPQQGSPTGRAVPAFFPAGADGGPESKFLSGVLDAPMFEVERSRLERLFTSREALDAHLADPEWVARALWAHVRTLEEAPPGP